jgi:hypothetical protein
MSIIVEEEMEIFSAQLQTVYDMAPNNDTKIVLGDKNAKNQTSRILHNYRETQFV